MDSLGFKPLLNHVIICTLVVLMIHPIHALPPAQKRPLVHAVPGKQRKFPADALYTAASNKSVNQVKSLLDQGANPDGDGGPNSFSPLIGAAAQGSLACVQLLVSHGAKVNVQDWTHCTPLGEAATQSRLEIAQYLLNHGADPNITDIQGWTPLQDAAHMGSPVIIQALLAHGADPKIKDTKGQTALDLAWEEDPYFDPKQNPDPVITLLASVTPGTIPPQIPPLIMAAAHADVPKVTALLASGVAVDTRNTDGDTALILGARDQAVMDKFVNGLKDHRYTPSFQETEALRSQDQQIVHMLLAHGAAADLQDDSHNTALTGAAMAGNAATVQMLLAHGADPNHHGASLGSPLMNAVLGMEIIHFPQQKARSTQQYVEIIRALLSHGAAVNVADEHGETPLTVSALDGDTAIIPMLLAHGANPNTRTHDGTSALMYAAINKGPTPVRLLLAAGADPRLRDHDGKTALDYALKRKNRAVVSLLKQALHGDLSRNRGG